MTNQLPLPSLMWKKNQLFKIFFNFRGGQIRQGCGSRCPPRHLCISSTLRFFLSCLNQLLILFRPGFGKFLTPKLRLGPLGVGGASCSNRLSIDLSGLVTKNVTGQVVELCLLSCRPFGLNGLDLAVSVYSKISW